jgi:hypothetical protein
VGAFSVADNSRPEAAEALDKLKVITGLSYPVYYLFVRVHEILGIIEVNSLVN